jgi:hypothetical protein
MGTCQFNKATVKEAPDPTDIIWENRHYTSSQICCRASIAFSINIGLLIGSFILLMLIARSQIIYAATFPPVDCGNIRNQYGATLE